MADRPIADLIPVDVSGDVPRLYKPVDRVRQAFTWAEHSGEPCPPLVKVGEFETTHAYGAPAFFKPSVAEVMDQLPETLLDGTHFSIRAANDGRAPGCFTADSNRHRAIVTVWRTAAAAEQQVITDQQVEIAALISTIGTLTREVERANIRADLHRHDLEQAQGRIRTLEAADRELREAWTTSRHFKRLRQYRIRAQVAEERAHLAESRLASEGVVE